MIITRMRAIAAGTEPGLRPVSTDRPPTFVEPPRPDGKPARLHAAREPRTTLRYDVGLSMPAHAPRPRVRFALPCAALVIACAGGAPGSEGSHGAYEESLTSPDGTDGATSVATSVGGNEGEVGPGSGMPPDLGACEDDADCELSDEVCYLPGVCKSGGCAFEPRLAGDACDDDDPCTNGDVCDGSGHCIGQPSPCEAPHAQGGTCVDGLCGGLTCDVGFGNCNGDWSDGCELPLDDAANCGGCDMPCVAGPHGTASCNAGACELSCDAPWADCDGDVTNGCEIPEGVANSCDAGGINMGGGCWTPYCGQSADPNATNFGTWYCMECSTCHVPAGGTCQWCNHATGLWYPAEAGCACGAYEDLACG